MRAYPELRLTVTLTPKTPLFCPISRNSPPLPYLPDFRRFLAHLYSHSGILPSCFITHRQSSLYPHSRLHPQSILTCFIQRSNALLSILYQNNINASKSYAQTRTAAFLPRFLSPRQPHHDTRTQGKKKAVSHRPQPSDQNLIFSF